MNTLSKAASLVAALALVCRPRHRSADLSELRRGPHPGQRQEHPVPGGFADSVWSNLIAGTIDPEGLSYTQAVQTRGVSWLKSLEGKAVTLREDGKVRTVTLVRASDLLIKDASGQYRNVAYSQLSFPVLPPENAQQPQQSLIYTLTTPASGHPQLPDQRPELDAALHP